MSHHNGYANGHGPGVPPPGDYVPPDIEFLRELVAGLRRDRDRLEAFVRSLAARLASQSEILSRAAGRGDLAARVAKLEAAIGPFAAILVDGWDDGSLPADALYPVRMGDLRRLARVLAGVE